MGVCIGVAVVYGFVWPRPRPGQPDRPAWLKIVLRWFHSGVWLLLAAAAFLWGQGVEGVAVWLMRLALIAYGVFLSGMVIDRRGGADRT